MANGGKTSNDERLLSTVTAAATQEQSTPSGAVDSNGLGLD